MIDVAIIGAGPAGLSAAINLVARNKKPVVFGRNRNTSWLFKAEKVDNHLGMYGMSGEEMLKAFYEHAKKLDVDIREGRVLQILSMGSYFTINFENEFINAKSIIIATGVAKGKAVKGENEYIGKGVSYCATCDGMLYKNKDVVVIGENKEGEEDSNFLSEICSKVYYIPKYDNVDNLKENIEVVHGKVNEVLGEEFVSGILVDDREIKCEGAFFIKESIPVNNLIFGLELENKAIKVNKLMETNIKGVFAAGDCIGWPFQVSNAIGEGLIAAQQCVRFLNKE